MNYLGIRDFPGCCNAQIIWNFGGTFTSQGLKKQISKELLEPDFKEWEKYHKHYSPVWFATTNSDQKIAAELLTEFGFVKSPEIKKSPHPESNLILWLYVKEYAKENKL